MSEAQPISRYEIKLLYPSKSDTREAEGGSNPESHTTLHNPNSRWPTLQSQFEQIPADAKSLLINHDVPTDEEWSVLGSRFTSVEDLEIEAGWNERLSDRCIPSHWPLERLLFSSSTGDVIQTPHILLGQVKHLVFSLTCGLRFEGPTSHELVQAHEEAVRNGEKEQEYIGEGRIKFTSVPALARKWMQNKYSEAVEIDGPSPKVTLNSDVRVDAGAVVQTDEPAPGTFNFTIFEILENDAIETYIHFAIALPHLAYNLRSLTIYSTNLCDLQDMGESMFPPLLQCLDQLEVLELTLGEVFDEENPELNTLGTLYQHLPPNIRELRFRGPVSLVNNTEWDKWVTAFGDPSFLGQLEVLSFVCDLAYRTAPGKFSGKEKCSATDDQLSAARAQCKRLTDAASDRQSEKAVRIEPFVEKRVGACWAFTAVDQRW